MLFASLVQDAQGLEVQPSDITAGELVASPMQTGNKSRHTYFVGSRGSEEWTHSFHGLKPSTLYRVLLELKHPGEVSKLCEIPSLPFMPHTHLTHATYFNNQRDDFIDISLIVCMRKTTMYVPLCCMNMLRTEAKVLKPGSGQEYFLKAIF